MERNDDVIDLGAATAETRGFGGLIAEDVLGKTIPGLSDDDA
jgi:hypothetical protein